GFLPFGSLIADAHGDLFGTTAAGGANGATGHGTVFEIAKTAHGYSSTPTTLVNFDFANGAEPRSSLIADAHGDLFGTTAGGGANGDGTVYEITGSGFIPPTTTIIRGNDDNISVFADNTISHLNIITLGNGAGDMVGDSGGEGGSNDKITLGDGAGDCRRDARRLPLIICAGRHQLRHARGAARWLRPRLAECTKRPTHATAPQRELHVQLASSEPWPTRLCSKPCRRPSSPWLVFLLL